LKHSGRQLDRRQRSVETVDTKIQGGVVRAFCDVGLDACFDILNYRDVTKRALESLYLSEIINIEKSLVMKYSVRTFTGIEASFRHFMRYKD
jgi:hypothetical protein